MANDIVTIIGMGEIGTAIYDDMKEIATKKGLETKLHGTDVNPQRVQELKTKGYNTSTEIKESDVYVIAVYTSTQVLDAVEDITTTGALISIESTIHPRTMPHLISMTNIREQDLVCFPHRYNPNDAEHRIFNIDRVIGAYDEKAATRAINFYKQFMPEELIHLVDFKIAALCKPTENFYRFWQIAFAQALKEDCDKYNIDFEELRKAMNTKWNIEILEARDGIGGRCLPKDARIISDFFNDNLFKQVIEENEKYTKKHSKQ